MKQSSIKLRPLEKTDLRFVHTLNNNRSIMNYWFEEPYEAFVELEELYFKHIHDQSERRFIAENSDGKCAGLVELVEIDYIHRRAEFMIIIDPKFQGKGLAEPITRLAMNYAFKILNLHKLYLVVAKDNVKALRVYEKCGFKEEAYLVEEFYVDGQYCDAIRMYLLQETYFKNTVQKSKLNTTTRSTVEPVVQ